MNKIVVPIDFSEKSINSLHLAKSIAGATKGAIHLINVVEPAIKNYPDFKKDLVDASYQKFSENLIKRISQELKSICKKHQSKFYSIDYEIKVGDPYGQIQNYLKEKGANLVIVGAKGFTDAEEFFLGSLTDKLIRSASIPVITVKAVLDSDDFKNIVYASDLQKDHKPMMNLLLRFQDLFGSKIHFVTVNTRKKFSNEVDIIKRLKQQVDKYGFRNATLKSYSHEDEEYGVVLYADDLKADLIAIGVNERSGFRRLISGGSIAEEVTDHTFRPVLTYNFEVK